MRKSRQQLQQHNTLEIDVDDIVLYVERDSGMIFEAKFFEDYALVRPATPSLYHHIKKVGLSRIKEAFDEFCGSRDIVLQHIATGEPTELYQETKR